MFGVDSSEFLLCLLIAVVVIGPKDLPGVLRTVGRYVGKARNMASQFRLGLDQMVRETELADLEKKWREQNESIMRAFPTVDSAPEAAWDGGKPFDDGARVSLDKPGDAPSYEDSDWGTAPVQTYAPTPIGRSGKAAPRPPVTGQPSAATPVRVEGERLSAARPTLPQVAAARETAIEEIATPEPAPVMRGTRRASSGRRAPRSSGPSA